jgi:hypothetical protein
MTSLSYKLYNLANLSVFVGPPLVDVVEHTTVSIGYGCFILQIDLIEE